MQEIKRNALCKRIRHLLPYGCYIFITEKDADSKQWDVKMWFKKKLHKKTEFDYKYWYWSFLQGCRILYSHRSSSVWHSRQYITKISWQECTNLKGFWMDKVTQQKQISQKIANVSLPIENFPLQCICIVLKGSVNSSNSGL